MPYLMVTVLLRYNSAPSRSLLIINQRTNVYCKRVCPIFEQHDSSAASCKTRASIDLSAAGRTHRPGRHALLRKRRIPCGLFLSVLRILVAVTSNHGGSSVVLVGTSESGTKRKCPNARVFPELGVDRLCHQRAGHSRP
jgi:hypothetical protein